MFTGIVQSIGKISAVEATGGDIRLRVVAAGLDANAVKLGDSVAVNGVCLTVADFGSGEFSADVSQETLGTTTLGELAVGSAVNLEPALTLATPLGGHIVSGHVDGIASVVSLEPDARSTRMVFDIPEPLVRYVARKGSVTVDGTSLTVNETSATNMSVNIVPHTLERTIMGDYSVGTRVNIEVDLIARYLEQLLKN